MQKQQSRGMAHVWCDSVSREGSSKFCLLVSAGLLWGAAAHLPGNRAAFCKLPSKLPVVPAVPRHCRVLQTLLLMFSYRSHAHSCSSQEVESLPALGSRPSELKPTQMIFFHFCHRSFVLVFQKPHVLSSLLHHCFQLSSQQGRWRRT